MCPHCAKWLVHCDVVDASAFSSTYLCACGSRLCHADQWCDLASGRCTAAKQLNVTIDPQGIDRDVFTGWGTSCAGASSYSDGLHYMSHDRCCDGGSSPPSWRVAFTRTDLNADKDLDKDRVCGGLACIFTNVSTSADAWRGGGISRAMGSVVHAKGTLSVLVVIFQQIEALT